MKQLKFLALTFGLVIASMCAVNAQKIGYVNVDGLVANLPEAQKVNQDFQKWQQDSIGGTYTRLMKDYQEKDSVYKKTATASVKQVLEKDLAELGQTLGNWEQIAGQASQQKRAEMFSPLYKKVMDAVNAYAKEKGYAHVLDEQVAIVAPEADLLTLPVAKQLGIKVNEQGGATPPAGAAPTSPVKK